MTYRSSKLQQFLLAYCLSLFVVSSAIAENYTWKPLTNVRAYTIKINPLNKNTLYIGNADDRVLRSYDAGKTWDTIMVGSGGSGSHLSTFHICRQDTNILLVGGWVYDGLKRSTDAGKTWTKVLSDPLIRQIWFLSEALVEDPHAPNILYLCRGRVVNEVYRSTDCGETWTVMGTIPSSTTIRLHTIAIRPDSSNILFTGCQSGVITRSDDSGKSWRAVPVDGKLMPYTSDAEIPKIVFSKDNPQVGYAIVTISNPDNIDGNGGTLKTIDGGATWNRIAFEDTSFWAVEIHPTENREDVWVGGFRTWTLPSVIKGDSIVRRSTDGGLTWLNYDNVPWQNNEEDRVVANMWVIRYDTLSGRLYLSTESGLYYLEEPVSVAEHDATTNTSVVLCEVIGTELFVRSRDAEIERLEFYSVIGSLYSNSSNVSAKTHTVSTTLFPSGVVFVVAHLANGESKVCPVLIGSR